VPAIQDVIQEVTEENIAYKINKIWHIVPLDVKVIFYALNWASIHVLTFFCSYELH
jgi:hypothetical protein